MDVERNGGATTQESFFAPVRRSLAGIIALSVIGAISGVIPFIAIVELARTLLPALAGGGRGPPPAEAGSPRSARSTRVPR